MTAGEARFRKVPAIRERLAALCGMRLHSATRTVAGADLAARHELAADALRQRVEALLAELASLDRSLAARRGDSDDS